MRACYQDSTRMPIHDHFSPVLLDRELTTTEGSRLAAPVTAADAALLGVVPESACFAPVFVVGECVSTFDVAWERARTQGAAPWSGVLAVSQTSGRGQLRREWISPPGNLYVSFFVPRDLEGLGTMAPLAVGFCIHAALREMGIPTRLKWPNDILLCANGREGKFGGLLLEERGGLLLAGLGLNVHSAPEEKAMRHNRAVPAVHAPDFSGSIFPFWLKLAEGMRDAHAREIAGKSRELLRKRMESSLAWMGQRVQAEEPAVQGVVSGLGADGSLLLQTDSGVMAVTSGSIRLV